jgi:AsmA-like protein
MPATFLHVARIPRWFLALVLLILFIPATTFILNHSAVRPFIVNFLGSQFGIEIRALHIRLVPNLALEVSDLLVRDTRTSEPSLHAPRASLTVRLWPLLTKQTKILELHAIEPDVVIRRDKDGMWHVPLIDEDTRAQPNSAEHSWVMSDIHVIDGKLLILDDDRLTPEGVTIHQVQAAFETNQRHTHAEVRLAGRTEDGGHLQIDGVVALRRIQTSPDATIVKGVPVQFDGTIRFRQFHLPYWLERTRQSLPAEASKTSWKGNLSSAIRLELLPDTQGLTVTISDMQTDLGWLVIRGNGTIERAGTNHPVYAMKLSTSAVGSDTFFAHVPPSWIPRNVQHSIREHHLRSTVELVSATLSGSLNVLREPDEWRIVAKLSHGSGVWGTEGTPIHNLSATVSLDPRRADVTEVGGEVNGVQVASTTLTVSDLDLGPTIEAHLLGVGPVDHIIAVLEQFDRGRNSSALRGMKDLTGTLQLAVHLAGPLLPKPSVQLMRAEVRLQDLAVRLPGDFSIAQVKGTMAADSRVLGIEHLQGMIQGMPFEAQGAVDLESGRRVTNFTMRLWSDGAALRELVKRTLDVPPDIRIEGHARAILALSGTAGAAHCRTTIDLSGTELIIPSVLHKHKGVPARVEFDAKIVNGKRVIVDDFRLVLSESLVEAGGYLDLDRTRTFHVHVKSGPLSLRALTDMGVTVPVTEGSFETSAVVTGKGTDWKAWSPSGWVRIRNGVVALPGLKESLRDLTGRIQVTPRGAVLDDVSFKIGDSDVRLTGFVEHWRHQPRATLMVESSHLDVTKFVANTHNDAATTTGADLRDWLQSKEATITFLLQQVRYERLVLRTVSGEIKAAPQLVTLSALRGETPQGALFGRAEARLGPRQRIDVNAALTADGIPTQELVSVTQSQPEPLEGTLSLEGAVNATVDADTGVRETLSTGRQGITVKVSNGRLRQDPVLTKVLKILNVPAVLAGRVDLNHGGIPFHSLTAKIIARDGVFSSEDIVFQSPILKVTGAGSADLRKDGLDLALAVSPLAAYSDLVGKIPLFGPLFDGDHAGISTALFEAKGSLGDPEVSYLPLESMKRGLTGYPRLAVDVLLNAMALPHTALAYATQ